MKQLCKRQQGIVLVTVLWAVTLFTVIAAGLAYSLRQETRLTSNHLQVVKAQALVDGAIYLGIESLLRKKKPGITSYDGREFTVSIDGHSVVLAIQDERGKVDINHAPEKLLQALIESADMGVDASSIARSVLDWRDQFTAADKAFLVPEELQRVDGMTASLYEQIAGRITVYTASKGVDPLTVAIDLLAHIPGMDKHFAEQHRQAVYGNVYSVMPMPPLPAEARPYLLRKGPDVYQITANFQSGDTYQSRYAVVHIKRQKKHPYVIIDWRDKFNLGEVKDIAGNE